MVAGTVTQQQEPAEGRLKQKPDCHIEPFHEPKLTLVPTHRGTRRDRLN